MDKRKELVNILKAELTLLTKDILQNIHQKDLKSLYKATRQLQEKMAAIMALKDQLETDELKQLFEMNIKETMHDIATESQPKYVEEVKQEVPEENPYKQIQNMSFVPKASKKTSEHAIKTSKTASNLKKINIGLNDRIAFIKHLFDGNQVVYTDFIDRLNAFDNYEDALKYINQEVKPQFNDWEGKDEYEFRLLQLLELKFA